MRRNEIMRQWCVGGVWRKTIVCLFHLGCCVVLVMASTFQLSKDEDLQALNDFGNAIKEIAPFVYNDKSAQAGSKRTVCKVMNVGSGYGRHTLCEYFVPNDMPCYFLSFGISTDYSFDTEMYSKLHCTGIALDPSIVHPLNFTPGVAFWKAGANSVGDHIPADWIMYSVPKLQSWFGHPLYALKMDCEGCEFVLANDILDHNPHFFDFVYQFNIEIHTPKPIMTKDEYSYDLGRMYRLLRRSGLELHDFDEGTCAVWQLRKGYQLTLISSSFPQYPGCQSFLFARNVTYMHWLHGLKKNRNLHRGSATEISKSFDRY